MKLVDDEEEEQGIIKEDNIRANTATTVVRQKAPKNSSKEQQPNTNPNLGGLSDGQSALMQNINDGKRMKFEEFLTATPDIPVYGDDPVRSTFYTRFCDALA